MYPGQTLQVDLCLPCSGENATLHIETYNTFLPPSTCLIAHQDQLVAFFDSTSSKVVNLTIISTSDEMCELFFTVSPYL